MENRERIRTRETGHNIKSLDRSAGLAGRMKRNAVRVKDRVRDLADDGTVSPEEYGSERLREAAEGTVDTARRQTKKAAAAVRDRVREERTRRGKKGDRDPCGEETLADRRSEQQREIRQEGPGTRRQYDVGKTETRSVRRREQTIRTVDAPRKTIRKASNPVRRTPKTVKRTVRNTGKTVRTAEMTARGAVKTARVSAEAAKKTAEVSARAAKTTAALSRRAAAAAYRAAVAAVKAVAAAVKAIIAGLRDLITGLAAGGWISVTIVVIVCLIGLIVGSSFGIFFSGERSGGSMTMREAVREINEDYENQIELIKMQNPYDELEMSGSRAVWPQVLSVYAVKIVTDPDDPMDVVTMDPQRKLLLSDIFWAMNDISWRTETKTETKIVESDDGQGNILQEEVAETRTTLYIAVRHLEADEMANQYGFNADQNEQLEELLAADSSLWLAVLYGVYGSDDMIVQVALSQIGNIGGEPYWSWYGFSSHVEWCACFVSWCADQCGYIENGVIPKYAGCVNGVNWFRERGQWADRSIEPTPGMIIFFDWDDPSGTSGPQDGLSDHTGIVEKIEDGFIYTVEGNSKDRCVERRYPVGSYVIMGYGVPAY